MKSILVFLVSALFSVAIVTATARTVTTSQGNANNQSVNAVAGPPPAKKVVSANDKSSAQPSKKTLKKARITPPPPMHDPN